MSWGRAGLGVVAVVAIGTALVSGGSGADPRTPQGLPGLAPPFLGTAVVGVGRLTAAVDDYGDVVDLRAPGPAGRALIDNPAARQTAGTVPADTGIVPWVSIDGRAARPPWRADSIRQDYLPGTNVLATVVRFGRERVRIVYAAADSRFACLIEADDGADVSLRSREPAAERRLHCDDRTARRTVRAAVRKDRRWLRRARPLAPAAPAWAVGMYERSLLVLRALTDRRTGAVAAGVRDGWAYVWPRDAAAAGLAFAAAGYRPEAARVSRFLLGLDLGDAARFHGEGSPVSGRGAQGDATGWVAVAAHAAGIEGSVARAARILSSTDPGGRADYQENGTGDFLADAVAARERGGRIAAEFGTSDGLAREAGGTGGLDSAAAWAVEPFRLRSLYPEARETMLGLLRGGGRFGITPGAAWPGSDPWSAPTAWTAWSLAALGERRQALRLMRALRRSATSAGTIPERVDSRTGVPRSTTPLAWSHAFAILALRELWPRR